MAVKQAVATINPNLSGLNLPQPLVDAIRLAFQYIAGLQNSSLSNAVTGSNSLTDINRLPKVTSAGTLGESSLTDNGTVVSAVEPIMLDTGGHATNQLEIQVAGAGAIALLSYAQNNQQIIFDADYIGGISYARSTATARFVKNATQVLLKGATGQTIGSPPVESALFAVNLSNGTVEFPATVSKYNNAATAGIGLSTVYVSIAQTNISGSIGTTNLQVGGAMAPAGVYRLSYYFAVRTTDSAGTVSVSFGWNDGIGDKTYPVSLLMTSGAFVQTSGQCIVTAGAANITYSTSYAGTGTYDMYIALERVG